MSTRTITVRADDLDGTEADDVREVRFSVDGTAYDIDLTAANRAALDEALKPYTKAGRKVARRGRKPGASK